MRIYIEDLGPWRLVLSRAVRLKDTEFKKVFIVPDSTRLQQADDKKLREKLKEIRESDKTTARNMKGSIVGL